MRALRRPPESSLKRDGLHAVAKLLRDHRGKVSALASSLFRSLAEQTRSRERVRCVCVCVGGGGPYNVQLASPFTYSIIFLKCLKRMQLSWKNAMGCGMALSDDVYFYF